MSILLTLMKKILKHLKYLSHPKNSLLPFDFVLNSHNIGSSNKMEGSTKCKHVKIGTHDGMFHCDEVLACYLLKQLPQYARAEIVRTRDQKILDTCDIVVDVGGVFNKENHRYDHHQRDFKETFSSLVPWSKSYDNVKLSSAGLIYVHFGEQIIREKVNLDDAAIRILYEKIYEFLIQEIDAIDNGISICDGEPKYRISTDLSSRVKRLNSDWNSPEGFDHTSAFEEAMDLVGLEFLDKVSYFTNSWWPAREFVKKAIDNRFNVHKSGEIIEFEERVPWKSHLFDLEKDLQIEGVVKYALFPDEKGSWRVQCVSVTPESFICRKFLKEEWWGVRDEVLSKTSGIEGTIFVHATGFIGGNKSRVGALEMAIESLSV